MGIARQGLVRQGFLRQGFSVRLPGESIDDFQMNYLQKYHTGPTGALHDFRARIERGEDAGAGFVGDSLFFASNGLPTNFSADLAAQYGATHRVELFQAAGNMQSITRTVVQAGPSGRRYRGFSAGTTIGGTLGLSMARADMDGSAAVSFEAEISLSADSLNGSGWPDVGQWMVGQGSTGNRNAFYLNPTGVLGVLVTKSGGASTTSLQSSAAVPAMTADVPVRYRVDFVADNGSNATARFYWSTDQGATWTEVGTVRTAAQASVARDGASAYWIGLPFGQATGLDFKIYHAQVKIGTTRDPILPERLDIWSVDAGQTAGTPVLGGSPTIYIDQAAQNGATLMTNGFFTGAGAGDFPTEAYRCWTDHKPDFVVIRSSHNDTGVSPADWETYMDSAVTAVLARYAYDPPILHMTQNPESTSGSGAELGAQHNRRQGDIVLYALKKGRGCADIYRAFIDANNVSYLSGDGVHPSSEGYAFEAQTFFRLLKFA